MIEKNLAIVEYRKSNPYLNMQQIATRFGLTRERIRQILKTQGVRTTSVLYGTSYKNRWGLGRHTIYPRLKDNQLLPTIDDVNWLAEIIENPIYYPESKLPVMELTV